MQQDASTRRSFVARLSSTVAAMCGVTLLGTTKAFAKTTTSTPVEPPIGTILAYILPMTSTLTPRWVLCDGRQIQDPASPFNNQRVPNLTDGRFLMGVAPGDQIGQVGGTNTWLSDGSHGHTGTATSDITKSGFHGGRQFESEGDHTFDHSHPVQIPSSGGHDHGEKRPAYLTVQYIIRIK